MLIAIGGDIHKKFATGKRNCVHPDRHNAVFQRTVWEVDTIQELAAAIGDEPFYFQPNSDNVRLAENGQVIDMYICLLD